LITANNWNVVLKSPNRPGSSPWVDSWNLLYRYQISYQSLITWINLEVHLVVYRRTRSHPAPRILTSKIWISLLILLFGSSLLLGHQIWWPPQRASKMNVAVIHIHSFLGKWTHRRELYNDNVVWRIWVFSCSDPGWKSI